VIGYDATLQGGLFNRKSVYNVSSNDIERFTATFNYGFVVQTKTLYFEYARSAITREFESGSSAKYGGIKIGFTFNQPFLQSPITNHQSFYPSALKNTL